MGGDTGVRAEHGIAPNLLHREFEADAPNRKWLADFTYVWTDALVMAALARGIGGPVGLQRARLVATFTARAPAR